MNYTKTFSIIAIILGIVSLAVGYAVINSLPLTISGTASAVPNEANFRVYFADVDKTQHSRSVKADQAEIYTITTDMGKSGDHSASFSVGGFKVAGDYAEFTYTVINASTDFDARISIPSIEVPNVEAKNYFNITQTWPDSFVIAAGNSQPITIRVTLTQNVTEEVKLDNIVIRFTATAVEN